MAKRIPPDTPPPQRLLAEVALIGGGAMLITSSVIHLLLWSDTYREVAPLGQILVLLGVAGILLALVVVRFATLGLVLAGAAYLGVTTALLLVVSRFELLGLQAGMPAPYTARSIGVPIVGLALLGRVAWLIEPLRLRAKRVRETEPGVPSKDPEILESDEQAPDPPAAIPVTASGPEHIRWPAERPPMRLATEPVPEPPALAPEKPASEKPAPAAAPEPEEAPEQPAAAAPEPAVTHQAPEPALGAVPAEPALGDQRSEPALGAVPAEPALRDQASEPTPGGAPAAPAVGAGVPGPEAVERLEPGPAPNVYPVERGAPESQTVEEPAAPPELAAEKLPPEAITEEMGREAAPTVDPAESVPPNEEFTQELTGGPEPIPDSVPEPVRSRLVREHEILERLRVALGPDDPGTLTIRGNIAGHYLSAGDLVRAADLQEAIAADSVRILGPTHPHTVTAQSKAVHWRKLAKKRRNRKVPGR
ncbi:MAG TPA: hypothetical protein VM754_11570 [Actinomycetota bacterium]|nr:hypothetical protein [Actinomycetota bacterium]